jgi:iron complex outermembrane receptor protein
MKKTTYPTRKSRIALSMAIAFPMALPLAGVAQTSSDQNAAVAPVKSLGVVTVTSGVPTSLPTQIPTTMESLTKEQIEQTVTSFDAEDALKYFPSLLVRKRYIADYNHAMLSSRASGTANSARSAVYADGILLSNYLGNGTGGLGFPPRWNMVTPEEIERVDVMYGPFSAAYPGNSAGAVVDYVTRMPTQLEAHVKLQSNTQPFSMYNTNETESATQGSVALGNKSGNWSWFVDYNKTDSIGQPLGFASRTPKSYDSTGKLTTNFAPPTTGTVVTGAVPETNPNGLPMYVLGTTTQYHTIQDHAKIKLAYDITPTMKASYLFGVWQNTSEGRPVSYLRDPAGKTVYSGDIVINGQQFSSKQALSGGDFSLSNDSLLHFMHGFSLKTHTQGTWDWELVGSLYDYVKDEKRNNSNPDTSIANPLPNAAAGGAGSFADGRGSGWNSFAAKGIWRPNGTQGEHIVDFGAQQDLYNLRYVTSGIASTGSWITSGPGTLASEIGGRSRLQSLYAQDAWSFAPQWKAVLGLRAEDWMTGGYTHIRKADDSGDLLNQQWSERDEFYASPKAALSYLWSNDLTLKASFGKAVRMPTLNEMYGATNTSNSQYINDPNLRPEKSITTELTAEKDFGSGILRLTYFTEDTRDSIYSQTVYDSTAGKSISRVQNVDRIGTQGVELAYNGFDLFTPGLDLNGSITYADSIIKENAGYVWTPGDTVGAMQPNIPKWRATFLANYRLDEHWNVAFGARYSGPQFRTLNNADINGFTYTGVSQYFTTDLRIRYKLDKQWSASFGIDNLNNYQYWNFHPYPQRNYTLDLKWDL